MSKYQSKTESATQPKKLSAKEELESPDLPKDLFEALEEKRKKGLWDGDVEHIEFKEHNLTGGKHYYEMLDVRKREIVCTTCPIRHGGILEAKMLTRYRLEKGVLYLDGKPCNETP